MKSSTVVLDLRVRRTYKFLWDALIALMAERDFESITVTDICDRAMVHRTTFYKHYEDKYGLLFHGIQDELNALFQAADSAVEAHKLTDNKPWLVAVFEHVASRASIYRLMLTSESFNNFNMLFQKSLAERLERRLRGEGKQSSIPLDLHAQVQAASLVSVITWWVKKDFPYTPAEMVHYIEEHIDFVKGPTALQTNLTHE